jgi:diphosphomevalonate decarboxylase
MMSIFLSKASLLARLGSEVLAESVKGQVVVWEIKLTLKEAPICMALNFRQKSTKISKLSRHYFISGQRRKQVSSTLGHDLMHNHPYAERRFLQAHENLDTLISIFKSGI